MKNTIFLSIVLLRDFYFMMSQALQKPYMIKKSEEFLPLIERLYKEDLSKLISEEKNNILIMSNDRLKLKGTSLDECICEFSHAHDRTSPDNTRVKIENSILNHIKENFDKNQTVNLISLGSGMLLQDLLIIINLVKTGFYSINLRLVEILFNKHVECEDFNALILALKNYLKKHGIKLNFEYEYHDKNNELKEHTADILYAIDYEDYMDYNDYSYKNQNLHRITHENMLRLGNYSQVIAFIRLANFLRSDNKSLAIISRGKDILSLNPNNATNLHEYKSLEQFIYNDEDIAAYYVNANLCHLLINMQYFMNSKKLMLINKNIIKDDNDIETLALFLTNHNLQYQFINEKDEIQELSVLTKKGKVIVVDYTSFDEQMYSQNAIPASYIHPNIHVLRMDYLKTKNLDMDNKKNGTTLFPSLVTMRSDETKKMKTIDEKIAQQIPPHVTNTSQKKGILFEIIKSIPFFRE